MKEKVGNNNVQCGSQRENDEVESVRENHQPGIEHDGEEDVAPCYNSKREDDGPGDSRNLPPRRKKIAREDSYHPKHEETDDER